MPLQCFPPLDRHLKRESDRPQLGVEDLHVSSAQLTAAGPSLISMFARIKLQSPTLFDPGINTRAILFGVPHNLRLDDLRGAINPESSRQTVPVFTQLRDSFAFLSSPAERQELTDMWDWLLWRYKRRFISFHAKRWTAPKVPHAHCLSCLTGEFAHCYLVRTTQNFRYPDDPTIVFSNLYFEVVP